MPTGANVRKAQRPGAARMIQIKSAPQVEHRLLLPLHRGIRQSAKPHATSTKDQAREPFQEAQAPERVPAPAYAVPQDARGPGPGARDRLSPGSGECGDA